MMRDMPGGNVHESTAVAARGDGRPRGAVGDGAGRSRALARSVVRLRLAGGCGVARHRRRAGGREPGGAVARAGRRGVRGGGAGGARAGGSPRPRAQLPTAGRVAPLGRSVRGRRPPRRGGRAGRVRAPRRRRGGGGGGARRAGGGGRRPPDRSPGRRAVPAGRRRLRGDPAGGGLTAMDGIEQRLLVVDDDPLIREELESLFTAQPYEVECVASVTDAMQRLGEREFALALVDVRIGGGDGIALTKDVREHWPDVDVIMITGYGSIKNAVEAMRQGAVDYITKPFQPEELLHAVRKALERRRLIDEIEYLRQQLSDRYAFANMVSRNPAMLEIFATLEMLARNDVTVLITGESGTGKELAARAIHFQGKRRAARFVAINCAAVPENLMESELFGYERGAFTGAVSEKTGKFEVASGGTIFLDEVSEMTLTLQGKLLRILQEKTFERLGSLSSIKTDARVIAATNRNLKEVVADKRFREDLYYRLNVFPI